jgi:hypothetical protein
MSEEEGPTTRCCRNCREWYDARADSCYICGEERPEVNLAAAKAAHAQEVNSHLFGEGNAAMRDHAATRNIPTGNMNGKVGPSGDAYRGARGGDALYRHFREQLREATGA